MYLQCEKCGAEDNSCRERSFQTNPVLCASCSLRCTNVLNKDGELIFEGDIVILDEE